MMNIYIYIYIYIYGNKYENNIKILKNIWKHKIAFFILNLTHLLMM